MSIMRSWRSLAIAAMVIAAVAGPAMEARANDGLEALGLRHLYLEGVPTEPVWPEPERPNDALPDSHAALGENDIAEAWLIAPTKRYGHAVLGDAIEAGGLRVVLRDGRAVDYLLDEDSVFEDLRPRLADLDGDGRDEIIVVRSYLDAGAALSVFGLRNGRLEFLGETSPIGQPHRWLNPVGAGDFDGDGQIEIAYVETPHIGGILRIVSLRGGRLIEEAARSGYSNHAMGSRKLQLSAVHDFDGDGSDDILVPANGRRELKVVSFAGGHFRELAKIDAVEPIGGDMDVAKSDGAGGPTVYVVIRPGLVMVLGPRPRPPARAQ